MPRVGDRVKVIKRGKVVASAQNLEVLSRYHRQKVTFADGAHAEVMFASYNVLVGWLKTKRKRSGWA